jgi:succinate dehydrogenase / fumarate reductase cytochrome b subunit
VRAVLLTSVGLHIWAAWSLTLTSWKARPVAYKVVTPDASTYASRTMRWSGVLLLAFLGYHLLHLTVGSAHPDFIPGDAYHNLVVGLQHAPAAIFYLVAMLALGLHLFHGASSMLQTLGLNHARWNPLRNAVSAGLAVIVVAGNLSFPASILAGLVS